MVKHNWILSVTTPFAFNFTYLPFRFRYMLDKNWVMHTDEKYKAHMDRANRFSVLIFGLWSIFDHQYNTTINLVGPYLFNNTLSAIYFHLDKELGFSRLIMFFVWNLFWFHNKRLIGSKPDSTLYSLFRHSWSVFQLTRSERELLVHNEPD